jgi:hypothetical protein
MNTDQIPIQSVPIRELTRFELLVKKNELPPLVAGQLKSVIDMCKVVISCDDSASMGQSIVESSVDANGNTIMSTVKTSTRWLELKKLAAGIITYVTAIDANGIDIHFLNRPSLYNVTDVSKLGPVFADPPNGGTPLLGSLRSIFDQNRILPPDKQFLLVVVITDGEPSDGTLEDMFRLLTNKAPHIHVSLCECTDNDRTMDYLDDFNGRIPNFDNTDDYREEALKIKRIQGNQFRFDYNDYVIKILLASFLTWYFQLDQRRFGAGQNQCCQIF